MDSFENAVNNTQEDDDKKGQRKLRKKKPRFITIHQDELAS